MAKESTLKSLKILNTQIGVGKTILHFDIAKLHTGTSIEVPIIIERAKKDGPVLLLLAGMHGDEVNGVEIVRQIITKKLNKPEAGTVICIPVMNVFGFLNQDRRFPDGRDLNRVFPGKATGSLAARYAQKIMEEIVPAVDYCIDFHTGGSDRFNYSQIRVDEANDACFELAKVFGSKFIVKSKLMDKTFRKSATQMGKKVLLFEGGKSLWLDREVTKDAILGTLQIMNHLGMKPLNNTMAEAKKRAQFIINESTWIRANLSGMFRRIKSLGEFVKKGEIIGSISDPYGNFEKLVKAHHNGFIICANHSPIVNQGDALVHISLKHEEL